MLRHREIPFPSTAISFIIFIEIAIVASVIYNSWHLQGEITLHNKINSELIMIHNNLAYEDQIRSLSTTAAIVEENGENISKASTSFPETLARLQELLPPTPKSKETIDHLAEIDSQLNNISEEAILRAARFGKTEGLKILATPRYMELKNSYRAVINTLSEEIAKNIQEQDEKQQRLLNRSIFLLIATIIALLLSWIMLLKALRHWRQIIFEFKEETKEEMDRSSRAEGKVAAQRSNLLLVIDHLPLALFAKEVANDLRFVLWNAKAEEIFGIKRETVIDKTDNELFLKQNEAGRSRAIDHQIIKSGKVFESDEVITTRQRPVPVHVVRMPIFDNNGQVCLILGILEIAPASPYEPNQSQKS